MGGVEKGRTVLGVVPVGVVVVGVVLPVVGDLGGHDRYSFNGRLVDEHCLHCVHDLWGGGARFSHVRYLGFPFGWVPKVSVGQEA